MKKGLLYISILLLVLLVGVSCTSTVRVSYLRPSDIDMSSYRNIAIASAIPYSGRLPYYRYVPYANPFASWVNLASSYSYDLPDRVADYATDELVASLGSSSYYNVLSPSQTDSIIGRGNTRYVISDELKRRGYDAVLIPKITSMSVNEYIWAVPDGYDYFDPGPNGRGNPNFSSLYSSVLGADFEVNIGNGVSLSFYPGGPWDKVSFRYYIHRDVSIVYTITVLDTSTNSIVATKEFRDSRVWTDDFDPYFPVFSNDVLYMFRSMISGFNMSIKNAFLPSRVSQPLSLMGNSPKSKSVEEAYKAAEDGNLSYALSLFLESWNTTGHVPSGYNASLLYAALGDMDNALSLIREVLRASNDDKVYKLYKTLYEMDSQTVKAESQMNREQDQSSPSTPDMNSIYSYFYN